MNDPIPALFRLITSAPAPGLGGFAKWWGGWALVAGIGLTFAVTVGTVCDAGAVDLWRTLGWCSVQDRAC